MYSMIGTHIGKTEKWVGSCGCCGKGEYKEMVLDPERGWPSILQNSEEIDKPPG